MHSLARLAPTVSTYLMSYMTLGIFWLGQQAQLNQFSHGTRVLAWIHIAFLCAVALLPFSTSLLAEYVAFRVALGVYWLNLLLLGVLLMISIRYAEAAGLLHEHERSDARRVHSRRIVVYQLLYALALLLSVINTHVSIGALIVLQLHSILGLGVPFARRRVQVVA